MLFDNPLTDREVTASVESSTTSGENVELVETCNLYVDAPEDAFQLNINVVGWPVAPLAGDASVGADGTAGMVVKFHGAPVAVVLPPLFFAITFQ